MKYKINLLLQKINWEYTALYSFYGVCIFIVFLTISILQTKRKDAEDYCTEKRGVVIQEKQGNFVCIKQKSIIKWETE